MTKKLPGSECSGAVGSSRLHSSLQTIKVMEGEKMIRKIGIEPTLTQVRDFLTTKGYTVENLNMGDRSVRNPDQYDAYIVTGMNKDFLGMQDTSTRSPVIDATGMTAEQVYQQLESRLR